MAHQKEGRLQLLSTLYTLDESYATEIIVGLEYDNFTDEYYKPVVRLLGDDFTGIPFTYDDWLLFTNCFNDFYKHLCDRSSDDMVVQQVCGTGWRVKFTRSQKEKIIEIEENWPPAPPGEVTKHSTIIMKKVTFLRLYEYIVKCINVRLEYLKFVAGSVSCVAREFIDFIKDIDSDNIPQTKVGGFTTTFVREIINMIDDKWFDIITTSVKTRAKKLNNQIPFSRNDIVDVFYQLASHHIDVIVDLLNTHGV